MNKFSSVCLVTVMGLTLTGCPEISNQGGGNSNRQSAGAASHDSSHQAPEKLDWLEQGTGNTVPDPNPPIIPPSTSTPTGGPPAA